MSDYPERVRHNILPRSVAQSLPEAFREWSFTESTIDHEKATETCQLCEQENLRYHFEIENALTHHALWVGSKCILQFQVAVYEHGQRLSAVAAKRKLDALVEGMRRRSCLNALRNLASAEPNDILSKALAFYAQHEYLTPKFAFVVFWRLKANHIDHSPSFFKVSLKRDKYREDLRSMPTERVHLIWPALSPSQRRMAQEMGHPAPAKA